MANLKPTVESEVSPQPGRRYRIISAFHGGPMCPDFVENRGPGLKRDQDVQVCRVADGLHHHFFMDDKDGHHQSESNSGPAEHPEFWELQRGPSLDESVVYLYSPSTERWVNIPAKRGTHDPIRLETGQKRQAWRLRPVMAVDHHAAGYYQIIPADDPNWAISINDHLTQWDTHLELRDRLPSADRGWFFIPASADHTA